MGWTAANLVHVSKEYVDAVLMLDAKEIQILAFRESASVAITVLVEAIMVHSQQSTTSARMGYVSVEDLIHVR